MRIDDNIYLSVPMWELIMLVSRFPKCCFVLCEFRKLWRGRQTLRRARNLKKGCRPIKRKWLRKTRNSNLGEGDEPTTWIWMFFLSQSSSIGCVHILLFKWVASDELEALITTLNWTLEFWTHSFGNATYVLLNLKEEKQPNVLLVTLEVVCSRIVDKEQYFPIVVLNELKFNLKQFLLEFWYAHSYKRSRICLSR